LDQNFIGDINFSLRCGSKVYCTISLSLQQNHAFIPCGLAAPLEMAPLKVEIFAALALSTSQAADSHFACGELDVEL